jgi:hypothetical protein
VSEPATGVAYYAEYLKTYKGNRQQHRPGSPGCDKVDHCHVHHVDEPAPKGANVYRECGECFHVYLTEEDLQREDLLIRNQMWQSDIRAKLGGPESGVHDNVPQPTPGSEIYSCPLCTHDF